MAVVAGRPTFKSVTNLHAMPLTPDDGHHALTVPVEGRSYGIDTAQIRPISSSSLGPPIGTLDRAGIARLNRTIASQLNLRSY